MLNLFYRIEKSRNRKSGGSGLGLYIVKMILDAHNGKYSISNSEKGVEFKLCLKKYS
ncbi:sensor histidine kinase [Clostridium botulinum]|nr:sensor histidine kinase [Clostridium botulinum]